MSQKKDERKYMEMAVKVMKDSVAEDRADEKAVPYVGAVLLDEKGNFVEKAYRGELRDGDHAEYTLIDKKLRDQNLTDYTLFVTLEPCAPGARSSDKTCCAKRISNARISDIWVGIEDPDPTVARKGIEHLKNKGITVHMFDQDLQNEIEKINKGFLEQALERATEEKQEFPPLSSLEELSTYSDSSDISKTAIKIYLEKSNLDTDITTGEVYKNLARQGFIELDSKNNEQAVSLTQAGLIMFGKNPRDTNPEAVVKAQIKYGEAETEINDFDEPLVLIPDKLETWLKKVLRSKMVRKNFERKEVPAFPIEVIREAVINALVHRDYDMQKAKIYLEIDEEKIVVKSPGLPVEPIQLEQLKNFSAPSLSRNPQIMYIFNQMHYVEERGLGMQTLKSLPEKYNLPLPEYSYDEPFLVLTFPRSRESVPAVSGIKAIKELNDKEIIGYEFIKPKEKITKREYADHFDYSDRQAERHLKRFKELGLIEKKGAGPSTYYQISPT
jgi:ATP-dependent DNA helicase RecG